MVQEELRKRLYRYFCAICMLPCFWLLPSCLHGVRLYQGIRVNNHSHQPIEVLSVKGLPYGYVTDCLDKSSCEPCPIKMPPGHSEGNCGFTENGLEVKWPVEITYRVSGGKDIKTAQIECADDGSRSERYDNSRLDLIYQNGMWSVELSDSGTSF